MSKVFNDLFADNIVKIVYLTEDTHIPHVKNLVKELYRIYYFDADSEHIMCSVKEFILMMEKYRDEFTTQRYGKIYNCLQTIKNNIPTH